MADTGQQRTVPAAFAPPPPLWKHFTRDNLDKLERIKTEASKGEDGQPRPHKEWTPSELRALDLPTELRMLVPPAIPTEQYSVFGELQSMSTVLPSLKDQGIDQLYPEPAAEDTGDPSKPVAPLNHAYYLLKISKSLLLNFLEFVGILSGSPEQFEAKVEDLRNLFINAHHLLNLYRPHQARESLIMMMEEQLDRTRDEIRQMDKAQAEIEAALNQLQVEGRQTGSAQQAAEEAGVSKTQNSRAVDDSRLIWDLLDKEN
ncbi:hypothetical protein NUU61_010083 [Penicillium alfredii]|uniref:Mediator of RNA polymerase II transcription subunit 7 n=1 Tax=Penicillium alfredii TaxID=1506179 RepID=A0A9W9EHE4_9EURO|nr:uncharacterized protein NUU61_010083 [Penicillium alfredii]KAJ5081819.1 hypothetical protein NUU61_010083 [Penicillium alfredii]